MVRLVPLQFHPHFFTMPWTPEQKRAQRAAASLVRKTIHKSLPVNSNFPLAKAAILDPEALSTEPPTLEESMLDTERARMEREDLRGHMLASGAKAALLGQRVFLAGEKVIVKESWWPIICPPLRNGQEPRVKFLLNKWNPRLEVWGVIAAQGEHKGKPFYIDIPVAALEHA